ncbi:MAG: heme exporter protein CcmB [Hyphomicrobiaceae bacterium]
MSAFFVLLQRELTLAMRQGGALGTALGFYMIVVAMMPLGLGPDLALLSRIAPGILWIGLMLAALLSLPRLFEADDEDGALELLTLGPLPTEAVVAAKALAHWLSTGIPLAILAPALGLLLNLDLAAYPVLVATLLAGTPAISFLGAIGAALTLRARRGGLLLALLVLPLYIPTLIFGISAIAAVTTPPGSFWSAFLILSAISLATLVLAPLAAAAALRMQES